MRSSWLDLQIKGRRKRAVKLFQFDGRKAANVSCQPRFRETCQFVAIDAGIMLQPFFNADGYLRTQPAADCVNWGTNHRGETGIDHCLCTNYNEDALFPGVERIRPLNQVKFPPKHLSLGRQIPENVFRFCIQFIRMGIDDCDVTVPAPLMSRPIQIPTGRPFKKARPVGIGFVDPRPQFLRECN